MAAEMNLWTRLTSESPKFFVRIQNIAISLGVTATGIIAALATIPKFVTPSWLFSVYGYIMIAAAVAGAVAKATMKDSQPTTTSTP